VKVVASSGWCALAHLENFPQLLGAVMGDEKGTVNDGLTACDPPAGGKERL
jgi:hypothetical protein